MPLKLLFFICILLSFSKLFGKETENVNVNNTDSVANEEERHNASVLKNLLFNPSDYWEKSAKEEERKSIDTLDMSISGKDLYEASYSFYQLEYKLLDSRVLNDYLNAEFHALVPNSGIHVKFDMDSEISAHQFNFVINRGYSEYFDWGVDVDLSFIDSEDLSMTLYDSNNFIKFDVETKSFAFNVAPFIKVRKEFLKEQKVRINFISKLKMGLSYRLLNGKFGLSGNLGNNSFSSNYYDPNDYWYLSAGANYALGNSPSFSDIPDSWSPDYDFKDTEFRFNPSISFGFELWLFSLCVSPSISFEKNVSMDDHLWIKSVGIYKVIGFYDSVFFRYSWLENDKYSLNEFELGVSISDF